MNSTSGILKDSASKVKFRLMALLGQLACEDTQKVQSRTYYVISVYVTVLTYYRYSVKAIVHLMLRPYYILTCFRNFVIIDVIIDTVKSFQHR